MPTTPIISPKFIFYFLLTPSLPPSVISTLLVNHFFFFSVRQFFSPLASLMCISCLPYQLCLGELMTPSSMIRSQQAITLHHQWDSPSLTAITSFSSLSFSSHPFSLLLISAFSHSWPISLIFLSKENLYHLGLGALLKRPSKWQSITINEGEVKEGGRFLTTSSPFSCSSLTPFSPL